MRQDLGFRVWFLGFREDWQGLAENGKERNARKGNSQVSGVAVTTSCRGQIKEDLGFRVLGFRREGQGREGGRRKLPGVRGGNLLYNVL